MSYNLKSRGEKISVSVTENMPWGTLNTFLVSIYILVYIYDICWRVDIESSEPGAYSLFMSYLCQLGFSLEFHCNTEVEMKVLDTSSWKGLLCFVIQHSPVFSVSLLSLSLCPFSLLSFWGLPSCFHCLFLAISGPSGSGGIDLHLNPSPSLSAVSPFLPSAWVLALSHLASLITSVSPIAN